MPKQRNAPFVLVSQSWWSSVPPLLAPGPQASTAPFVRLLGPLVGQDAAGIWLGEVPANLTRPRGGSRVLMSLLIPWEQIVALGAIEESGGLRRSSPISGNYFCYTRHEPVGVVGQIIPWNFPLLMQAWKWGPALAAGCTVVMKPAEQTPLTCLRIGELAQKPAFPKASSTSCPVMGRPPARRSSSTWRRQSRLHRRNKTGKIMMKAAAADDLKRLTFELGGKSPNIIFADADLDAAVEGAHFGLFFNQGQCCCAGSRLFVEQKIHDEFVDKMVEKTKDRRSAIRSIPKPTQGPQVDQEQFDKILSYIEHGKKDGAKCSPAASACGEQGYFIEPTLFTDVKDDMKIAREEIFGPVMSMLKFKDVDEVDQRATTRSTAWRRRSGRATSRRPIAWRRTSRPARYGSTATTCSTRPRRSADSR